nr:reverse transcriptase domain-containing protein [Tanacetum cinerariifolium]
MQDMSGCSVDQKVRYTVGSFVGKALTWWNSQIRMLSREVAVSMSWNDFQFMMIEEFCPSHEMQKLENELWNHTMVGAGQVAYTDKFHELARLVPHLVTSESRKIERYVYGLAPQIRKMVAATDPKTTQKVVQISGALIDEAVKNGSIKKVEKRENTGEHSKDKNGRDDNKRTITGNAFATTTNPERRENAGAWPKCTTCNSYHALGGPCRTCFNCNRPCHLAKDFKGVPRNVNLVNARNPPIRTCYECGSTTMSDMSGCSVDQKVRYTVGSFVGKALTWWNSQIRMLSREVAVSMSWNDFQFMMIEEFCPSHEMQKLENELWNHTMVGAGQVAYTDKFHELARLVPHLVTSESRKIERYVYGLAPQIR